MNGVLTVFIKEGITLPTDAQTIEATRRFAESFKEEVVNASSENYYVWFSPEVFAKKCGCPNNSDSCYEVAHFLEKEYDLVVRYIYVVGSGFKWYILTRAGWQQARKDLAAQGIEVPE